MDELKINVDQLDGLKQRLVIVTTTLQNDDFFTSIIADLVGDDELEHRVRDFSGKWNDQRNGVIEKMVYLRDSVGKIAESFAEVETKLTTALAPDASSPAAPAAPAPAVSGSTRSGGSSVPGARAPSSTGGSRNGNIA